MLTSFLKSISSIRLRKCGQTVKAIFPLLRALLMLLRRMLARLTRLPLRIPAAHRRSFSDCHAVKRVEIPATRICQFIVVSSRLLKVALFDR